MKTVLFALIVTIIVVASCKNPDVEKQALIVEVDPSQQRYRDSLRRSIVMDSLKTFDKKIDYVGLKKSIVQKVTKIDTSNWNHISSLFEELLLNNIIPYWYDTPWTFEGHTDIPNKGSIACGYFVSTTLKHIGMNLNRYKLAQQSPQKEALSLVQNEEVLEIYQQNTSKRIRQILDLISDGIHFVGFDQSHVGYLYKKNQDLYVIHSNYMGDVHVDIEDANYSLVFESYERLYIVELSSNHNFLKAWVEGSEIVVVNQ